MINKMYRFVVLGTASLMLFGGIVHAQSDTTPPSTPTQVSAYATQPLQQVNISWAASTDDTGVVGYYVYRNGGFVTNTPNTTYTDSPPPGNYTYTVAAYDAAGNVSPQSTPSPSVAIIQDTIPPSAPTWISLVPATSSIMLTWNPSTDNIGVVGYYLYRNGNRVPMPSPIMGTSYDDVGLLPGNTFNYSLQAFDAAGNTANSNTMIAKTLNDVTPPSVPASPSLSVKSPTEIDISWQPSTDNVGVVGYYIYQNGSEVAAVSSTPTSYANTNLSPSTVYLFSVAAFDAAGNTSNQSYAVQATTPAPDLTAPTAPRFLYANPISSSEIDLTWQASTDNVGVAGYYIDRDGVQVGTATGTAYADLGLTTSTLHAYTVQAYDAAGNISAPASVSATTLATGPATPVTAPTTPVYNPPPTTPTAPTLSFFFTTTLYYGLRSSDVTNLQTVLIQDDYLGPNYATGFFGSLTQKAVQQYQCAKAIVCYGNPQTTGWGLVGKRTRAALNAGS